MEAYRPLPYLYLGSLSVWMVVGLLWTVNTWRRRHFQKNHLQWILACVPMIKVSQIGLSYLFWYSCFNLQTCSLWVSFGVFVTGICFRMACFVSFLLISHGYCIMSERLSVVEWRLTASIGFSLYLALVGYKSELPYFTVLLLLIYFMSFYLIFLHISQNLLVLRQQLNFLQYEDIDIIHDAVHTKYMMFTKFRRAMLTIVVAEIMIYIDAHWIENSFWLHLLIREMAFFCILFYIGWTFRSQEVPLQFTIMPLLKFETERTLPPIYRLELNPAEFNNLDLHEWHIGVPTGSSAKYGGNPPNQSFVIVQHPHASHQCSSLTTNRDNQISTCFNQDTAFIDEKAKNNFSRTA
ncbi:uncharacterized protein LOC116249295 isoform X2 [Nymphaea colorata]|uniref:uncharacterized protein LOC116249295 isoform X2 n=1 Tax=Nymphaea colorata TaxID=210225 RepID=UPI00129E90DD|nr:uncharacterized protein LOC116249295 isoform X2 [Nymphaea colorata]